MKKQHDLPTDSTKKRGKIFYDVRKNRKRVETISSLNAQRKWPELVWIYLQKSIKMVSDQTGKSENRQIASAIDISKVEFAENVADLPGNPLKVCCK